MSADARTGVDAPPRHVSPAHGEPLTDPSTGLDEREAEARLAARGAPPRSRSSRSYASIVRANVFTVFNVILAFFGGLTLAFGSWQDALFLGVIVANSAVGVTQEVRAKRALDRLSLLVAPHATVRRSGVARTVEVADVLTGDVALLKPGDQVTADGRLLEATGLRLDESVLTGEAEPADRSAGEQVLSGAFVLEGVGAYEVTAVGESSFASRVTGQARSFRHPRSPLERAVNSLLYALVALVLGLGAALSYSLYHRDVPLHPAVSTATAGVVTLIPEGLMLLVSLTYAAAAVRMSRRGVLAQQLNAIESLASVDTICLDKTGTLTEGSLRVVALLPAPGETEERLRATLAAYAASATSRNATLAAIASAMPAEAEQTGAEVPFSSARRWSAIELAEGSVYLGAPERFQPGTLSGAIEAAQHEGRRVLVVGRGEGTLPERPGERPGAEVSVLGAVVLAEQLRPNVRETVSFLKREGVRLLVLSGDAPATAAAIAADVGMELELVASGEEIPADPGERASFAARASVIGRVSPEDKRAIVEALHDAGHYVAMVGDGVNDVPALKAARLAIAQGSGVQMARSVADLVLISGDFGTVPKLIDEGRRALRNLQRVARLYLAKAAFAAFLILTIGLGSDAYPLLPRQLTLVASLTVGIPTFFLALAPSAGAWKPERFATRVARFAVPTGAIVGAGVVAGYLFAIHDLDLSLAEARTVAVTILIVSGLYLVLALEAEGSWQRSTIVGAMCATLGGLYVLALLLEPVREFFSLTPLGVAMLANALIAGALTIGALALAGFTIRPTPDTPAGATSG